MISAPDQAAVRAAVVFNETSGNPDIPYRLSHAGKGNSGASFGVFQNDLHESQRARDAMQEILNTCVPPGTMVGLIMTHLSMACGQTFLAPYEQVIVNQALQSPAGRSTVDALDGLTFSLLLNDLESCVEAARGMPMETEALCYAACWINMTGAPTSMLAWLGGQTMMHPSGNVPPPAGPSVTGADLVNYLRYEQEYRQYPGDFLHLEQSVAAGVAA